MFNTRHPALLLALALIAALAAGYWFITSADSSLPPLDQEPTRERPAITGVSPEFNGIEIQVDQPNPAALPPSPAMPIPVPPAAAEDLPSADVPFSEQLPKLAELASKGHPTAACRLFVGVSRCTFQKARRDFQRRLEGSLTNQESRGSDELFIRAISQPQDGAVGISDCDGVDSGSAPRADDYLAHAIVRMSVRQKALLAMLRPDGTVIRLPREPDTVVRSGRSSEYLIPQILADNAVGFLLDGVASSDPLALEGLILIHAPGFLPGSSNGMNIALPDPHKFAHYALLMQTVYGPRTLGPAIDAMLGQTLARMNPNLLRQVEAEVEASAARWDLSISEPLALDGPPVGDAEPMCTAR